MDPDKSSLESQDLDLVDDRLEDEGKDDAALWQEFDSAEAATTDPDDQHGQDGDDLDAAAGDDDSDDDSAATSGDGSDDAPPRNGQSDDPALSDDAKARQNAQDQDLWANATPEQRAAYEAAQTQLKKLEQAERSNRGRLSVMQRQVNELMGQRQSPQKAASGEAAQGQDDEGQDRDADGFLASDDWKSFEGEYPEVAGPLGKLIGNLQEQITRQDKELSAIGTERRQSAMEEQATLLADSHPDWQDVTSDSRIVEWANAQPRHIKEALMRNANDIVDAEEAADVVGRFKDYLQSLDGGGNAQQQQDTPRADGGRGNGNNRAQAGKRQRQLESATTARSRGPGAASGISEDGDPETIWRQFDEMERRAGRA